MNYENENDLKWCVRKQTISAARRESALKISITSPISVCLRSDAYLESALNALFNDKKEKVNMCWW